MRHAALRAALRLALLALIAALLPALPADAQSSDSPQISLRLWLTPDRAARGDIVGYEIMVDNLSRAGASRVRVIVPLNEHLRLVKTEFDHKQTWVREVTARDMTIMFGRLNGGTNRRAKLFFEVAPTMPDGAQVRTRAAARYEGDSDEPARSNTVTLAIAGQTSDTQPSAAATSATAPRGTPLVFSVRNYFPGEKIFTWINAPDGVRESRLSGQANEQGAAELRLDTRDLPPGAYGLVVYGDSSKTTIVVPFTVQ
jgi:hypothetical protein